MRSFRKFAEGAAAVCLLLFLSEAVRYLLLNPRGEGSTVLADDPFRRPAHAIIYAVVLIAFLTQPKVAFSAMRRAWAFWLLSALAVASVYWSISPSASLRAAIGISATGLLGMFFDLNFSVREQLRLLAIALTVVMLASIAFALLPPYLGLEQTIHQGAWRGAYPQKNALGRAMALAVPVFALLLADAGRRKPFVFAAMVFAASLAALSQSATAPIVIAALALLIPLFITLRSRRFSASTVAAGASVGVVILGVLVFTYSDLLLEVLGRDASLSGRPLLWFALLPEIMTRPFLGFGISAFWNGGTGASAVVAGIVRWKPVHAHNGFIDVILDTGFVGLAVLLLGIAIAARRALVHIQTKVSVLEAAWPAAFLVFFVLSNMSESSILRPYTIFWFLYSSIFTRVTRRDS